MSTSPNPYRGFPFPAEIISEAVWLYHCFSLSLREVELILASPAQAGRQMVPG
jgi:putative transposase